MGYEKGIHELKAPARLLHFGSALYLFGLFLIMLLALQYGTLIILPDTLFRYEVFLVGGLVVYNLYKVVKP